MGKSKGKKSDICSPFGLKQCSSSRQTEYCLSGGGPPKDTEDHISSLPNDTLLFILSLLTCKERAKTSVLSRRWFYLWVHTQELHFDTPVNYRLKRPSDKECQKFVNQVNHALTLHKSQNLNEFRITFCLNKRYKKDISSWLGYALQRKVQKLEMNFMVDGTFSFDENEAYDFSDRFLKLNSEETVQVVKPDRSGNCFVKCLDFGSLKSLSLKRVKVTSEAIDFILRNSPFLERLEVMGSLVLHNLVISDPKLVLKYLDIRFCNQLEWVSISNINLVSLSIMTPDLRLTNLPMLVDLIICGHGKGIRRAFSQSSCFHSQLGSLAIHAVNMQDITQLYEIGHLTKLKRLEIRLLDYDDEHLITLLSIVEACPCLEEFVLMLGRPRRGQTSTSVAKAERRPLKCLKVFEFMGYYGRVGEFELVMHILENSIALEKIVLDPSSPERYEAPGVEEETARSVARHQFDGLKESIQPCVVIP